MRLVLELVGERPSGSGSPPVACASAHERGGRRATGSAAGAARGGTSRARARSRQPSKPDAPSLPYPATTRPSVAAPSSRTVRPAWFSKPAIVLPGASGERALEQHVADHARLARERLVREERGALEPRPVAPAIAAAEELVAAADGEERGPAVRPPRAAPLRARRGRARSSPARGPGRRRRRGGRAARASSGVPIETGSTRSSWPRAAARRSKTAMFPRSA